MARIKTMRVNDKISIYETIDPDGIFPIAYLLDEHVVRLWASRRSMP